MNIDLAKLTRKNNISAYLFLAAAILCGLSLVFFAFVFTLIFGSISAIFSGVAGVGDNGFYITDAWELYAIFFICVLMVFLQIAAFGLIKAESRYGRIVGIVTFIVTILTFTPFALLLIYPFAFLIGNDGKYFYQHLSKK